MNPGIDGHKMSKKHNNIIPVFSEISGLREWAVKIFTAFILPIEHRIPENCNIFNIYKLFVASEAVECLFCAISGWKVRL